MANCKTHNLTYVLVRTSGANARFQFPHHNGYVESQLVSGLSTEELNWIDQQDQTAASLANGEMKYVRLPAVLLESGARLIRVKNTSYILSHNLGTYSIGRSVQ